MEPVLWMQTRLARMPWSRVAAWATVVAAGAASARFALELAKRALFPWDLLIWSESPFMTDMLKLASGASAFGPPADVNSFVYSPGLEYLCYALLAPFGSALDVRFSRSLSMAFGFAAALLLACLVLRWVSALEGERRRPLLACGAFFLGFLLLFRSPTMSAVHPDGLHVLHAFLTFALCSEALRRQDYRLALAAMCVSGLGVWTKQPAALSFVGAGAALTLGHPWGRSRALALFAVGAALMLASLACLLGPEQSRFYLLELPLHHGVKWSKVVGLIMHDIVAIPHRLLIWLFGAAALGQLWVRSDAASARTYLVPWLCIGVFNVLGSFAPYMKAMGIQNNLYPMDLWWLIPVLVAFVRFDAWPAAAPRPFAVVLPVCLALCLLPVFDFFAYAEGEVAPNQLLIRDVHYAYGREYDALVKRDLETGKRVLIAHGTMTWIRSGRREPPLDRMVSALELEVGEMSDRAGTAQRLAERAYDRIYLPSYTPWFDSAMYGPAVKDALAANYREVGEIAWPRPLRPFMPNDGLMVRVAILEPVPR